MLADTLLNEFGSDLCAQDEDLRALAAQDAWQLYAGATPCVLRPRTVDDVAAMLRFCADKQIALVPQGGNTGLAGGATPDASDKQVVLSLSRLDRIRELDVDNYSMTVEAGCIVARVQQAAADAKRLFPLTLGAEGTCQVGGVIATNAGGNNVLRYGNTRDLVLGLEVVLNDGRIWHGLRKLRKNNSGYDLKQLFIGAEGTLGVITAAVLKLFPQPCSKTTMLVAIPQLALVPQLLAEARAASADTINAFELISRRTANLVRQYVHDFQCVPETETDWYALIEMSGGDKQEALDARAQDFLETAYTQGHIVDATVANNMAQQNAMWQLRDGVSEAQKKHGAIVYFDVSVPVSAVPAFIQNASSALRKHDAAIDISAFGHAGDGNIHFNLLQPPHLSAAAFLAQRETYERIVFDVVAALDGSFSAEHGVGQGKLDWMPAFKSELELELMRRVRSALSDPQLINPGKLIP